MNSKNTIRLTESQLISLLSESINEISSQYIQDRVMNAYNRNQDGYMWDSNKGAYVDIPKDRRIRDMRHLASDRYHSEHPSYSPSYRNNSISHALKKYKNNSITFIDDSYSSLEDLINGINAGELLIHCRRMQGYEDIDMIYPEAGECVQDAYGSEYGEYGLDIPELVFASDDFTWAEGVSGSNNTRDGIYFVKSDTFMRSLGDGRVQYPNGEISSYYINDMPLTVESGDWYSEEPVEVVAIMKN